MDEHFRVAASPEYVSAILQLTLKLGVIVDLAVVRHDYLTVFVGQRLCTSEDVDNAEPNMSEANALTYVEPIPVRATVPDGRCHPS